MENTTPKKLSRKEVIRRLAKELEEPIAAFQLWYGIGLSDLKTEPAETERAELADEEDNQDEEDDSEDYELSSGNADPEDIQMAVHLAMSNLQDDGLIDEDVTELSNVCEQLFGPEHELTKDAVEFEELINGYEGSASMYDLWKAYHLLSSMQESLKKKGGPGNEERSLFS